MIFHVADEQDANAWQSGVYYADDTPKTSMDGVRLAALAAQSGTFASCAAAKTASSLVGVVFRDPAASLGPLEIDLTCDTTCTYRTDLIDLETGRAVSTVDGAGTGDQTVSIPQTGVGAGSYQYALRTFTSGRPGTAVTRYSRPFTVPPAPLGGQTTLLPLLASLPTLVPISPLAALVPAAP